MTEKKPNQKRHAKTSGPEPTPEQRAAELAAFQKREEELKKEAERIELFGKSVKYLSHRQLVSALQSGIKREQKAANFHGVIDAVISKIVLQGTRTSRVFETNQDGVPTRVARLDQINKLGVLHAYPR